MPRPRHLTWEESACYTLTLATAYRMLFGHTPHELRPGQNVLVWGASGGLGSFAIQLVNTAGANAIAVISHLICYCLLFALSIVPQCTVKWAQQVEKPGM